MGIPVMRCGEDCSWLLFTGNASRFFTFFQHDFPIFQGECKLIFSHNSRFLVSSRAISRSGSCRGREPEGRHYLAAFFLTRNLVATAGIASQVRRHDAATGLWVAGFRIDKDKKSLFCFLFETAARKVG